MYSPRPTLVFTNHPFLFLVCSFHVTSAHGQGTTAGRVLYAGHFHHKALHPESSSPESTHCDYKLSLVSLNGSSRAPETARSTSPPANWTMEPGTVLLASLHVTLSAFLTHAFCSNRADRLCKASLRLKSFFPMISSDRADTSSEAYCPVLFKFPQPCVCSVVSVCVCVSKTLQVMYAVVFNNIPLTSLRGKRGGWGM